MQSPPLPAGLPVAQHGTGTGVRIPGASEAQWKQLGLQREPPDERFIARLGAWARQMLWNGTFAAKGAAGVVLGYPEALAEAHRCIASGMPSAQGGESNPATL